MSASKNSVDQMFSSKSCSANQKNLEQVLEKKGYKLLGTLGNGTYAKVKEAEYVSKSGDTKVVTKVAAKIIDRRKAPSDFLNKFMPRELDIYLKLDFNHIIKVFDIIELNYRIYIFMELAEGGDLLDFIKKRGILSNSLAKRMFSELSQAIKYCHSLQITHRDLKCENILLDKNYHIKLADFGFGRSCVDAETGKRILSRTYCGSAAYAAPEILQGTPYNPKLYDIWSLGCILYIMVCSCMPFDDTDVKKMIKIQLEGKLKYPSKITDKIDPLVKDLISLMLEPDVTKRANIDKVMKHCWLNSS